MFMISNAGINPVATDVVFAIVMILLAVAVIVIGAGLLVKCIHKDRNAVPKKGLSFAAMLSIVILCGVILRIVFSLTVIGFREDFTTITDAMEYVALNGFKGYYSGKGIMLYPLTLLIYSLLGVVTNSVGISAATFGMALLVKLPFIVADIVSAAVLYKLAAKYVNGYVGVIVSGIFMLSPAFMMASSIWGSEYALLTAGLLLSLYFMATKNYLGLFASYAASLLLMKDAIYLFPLFAVFVVYNFIKALKKVIAEKIPAKDIWSNPDTCQVIRTPVYLVIAVLLSYLISLPTMLSDFGANFFTWIYRFSLKPLADIAYFGFNSLGIFNIFVKNGEKLGANFPTVVFAVIFAVIILGIVLLVYLSKKNRANLVFLGGYIIFTLATYYVDFSAMSLVPVLGIFLLAFILIKDRRILQVFGVLSLLVLVNSTAVLIGAGYVNNASEYLFDSSFYLGSSLLSEGLGLAVSIICSVLAVLAHLYSTMILLDLSMSNKRKLLEGNENAGLLKSVTQWIKP